MDSNKNLELDVLDYINIYYKKKFKNEIANTNIYFKVEGNKLLIIIFSVDEIISGGNNGLCKGFDKEM